MGLVIGIDTGGTFTDMVIFDPATGEVDSLKTSSTPATPGQAIVNALDEGGVAAAEIDTFTHGTTVGTNALIERTGCRVAFVTTKGFEDTPFIQRINRKVLYDLRWTKPAPLVASRRLCLGLAERLDSDGAEVKAVDEDEVRELARRIRDSGADAVALCLLFSYVSTDHEDRVKAILTEELPGVPISVSSEVAPIWREYERSSTTIADAYLRPLVGRYVGSLDGALRDAGMTGEWTMMKSNGGAMLSGAAAEAPIQTVMSGPAGGMTATEHIARALGETNVLTLDMGGTSADVGILVGGAQRHTTEYEIEWGLPAAVPLIDIKSIGAGGGSIAWVDAGGFLRVGPRSAGADPGPICYGRGGTQVTVTDANLLLGRLNPEYFLAGRMRLDTSVVSEAMEGLGRADRPRSARARGVDRRDREREHGERDQDGLARAGPRPAPLLAARLRRRGPAARCGRRAGAGHPEGDRAPAPRRLLGARAAPRRHPRRQDLDAGVPVQHRGRVGREPPVRPDHRARARRASARGLCRRAGDSTRDQHALLRAELRARGRDRAGRVWTRRPSSGRSAGSTSSTPSATATRSPARSSSSSASRSPRSASARHSTSRARTGRRRSRARSAPSTSAGEAGSTRPSRTAPRSSRAR